jgi:hypothetical protein
MDRRAHEGRRGVVPAFVARVTAREFQQLRAGERRLERRCRTHDRKVFATAQARDADEEHDPAGQRRQHQDDGEHAAERVGRPEHVIDPAQDIVQPVADPGEQPLEQRRAGSRLRRVAAKARFVHDRAREIARIAGRPAGVHVAGAGSLAARSKS